MAQPDQSREPGAGRFATTSWSLVRAAGQGESPGAGRALAELSAAYWYPLYVYVRRRGCRPEEAEDLTQAFFARVLEGDDILQMADPGRGRFRSFLLAALEHFLANHWYRGTRSPLSGRRNARTTCNLPVLSGQTRHQNTTSGWVALKVSMRLG
jgi:DNA-directed RNA polymerase specialized sigma24 family protein